MNNPVFAKTQYCWHYTAHPRCHQSFQFHSVVCQRKSFRTPTSWPAYVTTLNIQTFYVMLIECICVLYGSQHQQKRLIPYTAVTKWMNRIPTRCNKFSVYFTIVRSKCFGRHIHPSSGASRLYKQVWYNSWLVLTICCAVKIGSLEYVVAFLRTARVGVRLSDSDTCGSLKRYDLLQNTDFDSTAYS